MLFRLSSGRFALSSGSWNRKLMDCGVDPCSRPRVDAGRLLCFDCDAQPNVQAIQHSLDGNGVLFVRIDAGFEFADLVAQPDAEDVDLLAFDGQPFLLLLKFLAQQLLHFVEFRQPSLRGGFRFFQSREALFNLHLAGNQVGVFLLPCLLPFLQGSFKRRGIGPGALAGCLKLCGFRPQTFQQGTARLGIVPLIAGQKILFETRQSLHLRRQGSFALGQFMGSGLECLRLRGQEFHLTVQLLGSQGQRFFAVKLLGQKRLVLLLEGRKLVARVGFEAGAFGLQPLMGNLEIRRVFQRRRRL